MHVATVSVLFITVVVFHLQKFVIDIHQLQHYGGSTLQDVYQFSVRRSIKGMRVFSLIGNYQLIVANLIAVFSESHVMVRCHASLMRSLHYIEGNQ